MSSQSEAAQLVVVLAQDPLQQWPVPSAPQIVESQLSFEVQGAPAARPEIPPLVETDEPEVVSRPPEEVPVLEAAAEAAEVEVVVDPELEPLLLGGGRVTVWAQPSASNIAPSEVGNSCLMPSLCSVLCISHPGSRRPHSWDHRQAVNPSPPSQ